MTVTPKYIFAGRGDGLGGRLFNLLWSWRLSRKYNTTAVVFWPGTPGGMTEYFGHDFRASNIFDLYALERQYEELRLRIIDGPVPKNQEPNRIDERPDWKKRSKRGWSSDELFDGTDSLLYMSYKPLYLVGESRVECEKELHSLFHQIPLAPIIVDRISTINDTIDLGSMVAIHYRRGDIAGRLEELGRRSVETGEIAPLLDRWIDFYFQKCAPASAYVDHINQHFAEDSHVLLFSDDRKAFKAFRRHMDASRLITISQYLGGLSPLQRGLVEMMCMSSTKAILSTNSGFSSIASLIGDTPKSFVKFHTTPRIFLGEFGAVSGFSKAEDGGPIMESVVDILLSSPIFGSISKEMGWSFSRGDLSKLIRGQPIY